LPNSNGESGILRSEEGSAFGNASSAISDSLSHSRSPSEKMYDFRLKK
jgi:hypothetical protein